jgi:single-strand DNA-binding protein
MNVLNFTGNLGRDAEIRYTNNQKVVTSFAVALSSGWGERKTTTWINCSMWGDRGVKVAEYLKKGQMVAVSGEFSTREYDKDGVTNTVCDCNVNDVTLCGSKGGDGGQPAQPNRQAAQPASDDLAGDIPF